MQAWVLIISCYFLTNLGTTAFSSSMKITQSLFFSQQGTVKDVLEIDVPTFSTLQKLVYVHALI